MLQRRLINGVYKINRTLLRDILNTEMHSVEKKAESHNVKHLIHLGAVSTVPYNILI